MLAGGGRAANADRATQATGQSGSPLGSPLAPVGGPWPNAAQGCEPRVILAPCAQLSRAGSLVREPRTADRPENAPFPRHAEHQWEMLTRCWQDVAC